MTLKKTAFLSLMSIAWLWFVTSSVNACDMSSSDTKWCMMKKGMEDKKMEMKLTEEQMKTMESFKKEMEEMRMKHMESMKTIDKNDKTTMETLKTKHMEEMKTMMNKHVESMKALKFPEEMIKMMQEKHEGKMGMKDYRMEMKDDMKGERMENKEERNDKRMQMMNKVKENIKMKLKWMSDEQLEKLITKVWEVKLKAVDSKQSEKLWMLETVLKNILMERSEPTVEDELDKIMTQ